MPKAKAKTAVATTNNEESFAVVWRRADKNDATPADRAAFRERLERNPDNWHSFGDMVRTAESSLIESVDGTGLAKEFLLHGCAQLRKELTHGLDGPLDKMLIDVCVLAWLRLGIAEQLYTINLSKTFSTSSGEYWEKRLTLTHKRFQNACLNLARVRKLTRPKIRPFTGAVSRDEEGNISFNREMRMNMAHIFDGNSIEDARALTSAGIEPKRWKDLEAQRERALTK